MTSDPGDRTQQTDGEGVSPQTAATLREAMNRLLSGRPQRTDGRLVKAGAQWIKTYPTGDAAAPDTNDQHTMSMTREEMDTANRNTQMAGGPRNAPQSPTATIATTWSSPKIGSGIGVPVDA